MTNELVKLKGLLQCIPDNELAQMELWIDNETPVQIIATDDRSITLITDESKVKIDGKEW